MSNQSIKTDEVFWIALQALVKDARLVIDRPQGTAHPRYPDFIYPLDYGYLEGTTSVDGGGVDVWAGSADRNAVTGVIATVDLVKHDTELKILLGCTQSEMETAYRFHNNSKSQRAILIERPLT